MLEGGDAAIAFEAEHIDDLVEIEANACAVLRGYRFEAWLLVVEYFGIILPVLHGIEAVIAWFDLYFLQCGHTYLERYIKLKRVGHFQYRKFHGGLAEIAEPDGIFLGDLYHIMTIAVGGGAFAGAADHTYSFKRIIAGAVVHIAGYPVSGLRNSGIAFYPT